MLEFILKTSEMLVFVQFILFFVFLVTSPLWISILYYIRSKQDMKKRLIVIKGGKL